MTDYEATVQAAWANLLQDNEAIPTRPTILENIPNRIDIGARIPFVPTSPTDTYKQTSVYRYATIKMLPRSDRFTNPASGYKAWISSMIHSIHDAVASTVRDELSDQRIALYAARIQFLRDEASRDSITFNAESETDFKEFVRTSRKIRKGSLFLMDNGNLRAVWGDSQKTHLGLQFLGNKMVQYVIFKRRKMEQPVSRVAGRDTMEGIERQIDAFDLYSMLYE